MSTRLFIGVLSLFVLAQLICNFVEGNSMYTNANVADIYSASNHTYTVSATSSGASINFVDKTLDFMDKLFLFDYSIFKDVNYSITESQCSTIGGEWNSSVSACSTTNDFVVLRYLLIVIGIVMWIELAVVLKNLFSLG